MTGKRAFDLVGATLGGAVLSPVIAVIALVVRWKLGRPVLDELPELWNVARGDMSLVGPRPLLLEYLPRYSARQARRHEVRPGLSGWAQVNGRNAPDWDTRLEMDVWYVDNRTFWLDITIIARTLWSVVRREGVTADGHATVERFDGPGRTPPG